MTIQQEIIWRIHHEWVGMLMTFLTCDGHRIEKRKQENISGGIRDTIHVEDDNEYVNLERCAIAKNFGCLIIYLHVTASYMLHHPSPEPSCLTENLMLETPDPIDMIFPGAHVWKQQECGTKWKRLLCCMFWKLIIRVLQCMIMQIQRWLNWEVSIVWKSLFTVMN